MDLWLTCAQYTVVKIECPEAWGHAFSWGGSVWHIGNSGFSGELVSFVELGQPDLIKVL